MEVGILVFSKKNEQNMIVNKEFAQEKDAKDFTYQ